MALKEWQSNLDQEAHGGVSCWLWFFAVTYHKGSSSWRTSWGWLSPREPWEDARWYWCWACCWTCGGPWKSLWKFHICSTRSHTERQSVFAGHWHTRCRVSVQWTFIICLFRFNNTTLMLNPTKKVTGCFVAIYILTGCWRPIGISVSTMTVRLWNHVCTDTSRNTDLGDSGWMRSQIEQTIRCLVKKPTSWYLCTRAN